MLRKLRVGILFYVLALVAVGAWLTKLRSTDWSEPLWVLIYPINADGSAVTAAHIAALERATFVPITSFLTAQARRHGLEQPAPVTLNVAAPVSSEPPLPPAGRNPFAVAWWSLRLRHWAWQVERRQAEPAAQVQIFVLYHDPASTRTVPHSLGLREGMIGVVHAFASPRMTQSNNVIIAHELLHTVGATDKYDPVTNQPAFPDGFAEPHREPLYPQPKAELMAGRIPLAEGRSRVPEGLHQVLIGPASAREINWR